MPVTFKVATHDTRGLSWLNEPMREFEAKEVSWIEKSQNKVQTEEQILNKVWRGGSTTCKELLQSSLKASTGPEFNASRNGFVDTVAEAYNFHHHLVIRPDDIWQAILTQLSFYINAHAEELRSKFVAHTGKKELRIFTVGTRYSVDFGDMAKQFSSLLKGNIVDETLYNWVMPDYSTTTDNDRVICSITMMATLGAYFSYRCDMWCGVPSITLEGEKEDYLLILKRLNGLEQFGVEPTIFARFLRPILKEFSAAFDYRGEGDQLPNPDFWKRICHWNSGSGSSNVGGWITAFCVWNGKGIWQGGDLQKVDQDFTAEEKERMKRNRYQLYPLFLNGMRYPVLNDGDIPSGVCQVDVEVNDHGVKFECMMVAGHIGTMASEKSGVFNTVQPTSGWFMFVKGEAEKKDLQKPV